MIVIKREDVEIKSNSELLNDFHESRFHHKDYISLSIVILLERGFTTTTLFDNKTTDEMVNIICFEIDKHKEEYINLVKEELINRNYNINSIPDIKKQETFSSHINDRIKPINSSNEENTNTKRIYLEDEEDVLIEEKKSNKYKTAITALVIIGIIKLGLMYVRNKDEDNSKEQINKIEVQLYGENGILNSRVNSIKQYLDSVKIASPTFTLSSESKNEFIQTEIDEIEKIFSKLNIENNDLLNKYISEFISRYKIEIERLLNSYSNTEVLNDSSNLTNEK
jgi:hypothetical protein